MTKSEIIEEFLNKITSDIAMIDGGCHGCIEEFCDNVNDSLLEYSMQLQYTEKSPVKVTIKNYKMNAKERKALAQLEERRRVEKVILATWVRLPDRNHSLKVMIDEIGLANRISYFNEIDTWKGETKSQIKIGRKTVDNGLMFQDGTILKHVDFAIFKYFDKLPIVEIKERI